MSLVLFHHEGHNSAWKLLCPGNQTREQEVLPELEGPVSVQGWWDMRDGGTTTERHVGLRLRAHGLNEATLEAVTTGKAQE